MSPRTPPNHGQRACYVRGCRRPECLTAHYRYMSRYRLDREQGTTRRVPIGPVAQHVQNLRHAGWTIGQIAVAAGCGERTVSDLQYQRYQTIRRDIAQRILKARPTLATVPGTTTVPAIGTIRRVQALMAIGHTLVSIAIAMPMAPTALSNTVRGCRNAVTVDTARAAECVYKEWSETPGPSRRSRDRAADKGWPPPAAWDDERIADPATTPDWTGYCGTDRGYWTHRMRELPMCPPCEAAHQQWCDEHADVGPIRRNHLMFAARAAASTRGTDLAHDGRELMRVSGLDYEQAAERLGVTRQHLQQELIRHPEGLESGEAA